MYTWFLFPISDLKTKIKLTLGLGMGISSLLSVQTVMGTFLSVLTSGNLWDLTSRLYIWVLPAIVALFLIADLWIKPSENE